MTAVLCFILSRAEFLFALTLTGLNTAPVGSSIVLMSTVAA